VSKVPSFLKAARLKEDKMINQPDFWAEIKEQNKKEQDKTNQKAARFPKSDKRGKYSGLSKRPYGKYEDN